MIEIKNKILNTELVEWKKLTFIQTDTIRKLIIKGYEISWRF